MFEKKELVNDKTGEHYTKYFYTYNESDQIVGILFGHFAPFTGPNGHGRMVTALKNIGAKSFLIVTPENNKPFDDEREMFNATQRAEIIQSYLDSEGLNGVALPYKMKRGGAKSQMGPLVALAAEKFGLNIRPVFCFGPDREDLAAEVCNKFGEIKDPTHCEYIVDYERGTSGTKVRQLIKANDTEGICKETGYKTEVAEKLIKLRTENMKMNESAEFEEIYKLKEWIGKNTVTLSFSNRDDAVEFKDEMKQKFHYPKTRSQYEVVHGTTKSGNTVFVESTKKLKEERTVNVRFLDDSDADYIIELYHKNPLRVADAVDTLAKSYDCHVGDCERQWDYYTEVVDLVFEEPDEDILITKIDDLLMRAYYESDKKRRSNHRKYGL